MRVKVELRVRPREGVRDPQGDAVQEALRGIGFEAVLVHAVGRTLHMEIDAESESAARAMADDMCRRLLVNPNLETYTLTTTA